MSWYYLNENKKWKKLFSNFKIIKKEDLRSKSISQYSTFEIIDEEQVLKSNSSNPKIPIRCKVCQHEWTIKISNVLESKTECYKCLRKKGDAVDEVKIFEHINEKYIQKRIMYFLEDQQRINL